MDISEKSVKVGIEIIIRCPKCKCVAAHETVNNGVHTRSWNQEMRWGLQRRWPFVVKKPVPYELKCPKGCNLED